MKQNNYEITYVNNETKQLTTSIYSSKQTMIQHYLNILTDQNINISELKAIKNGKDYTSTLNKFLFN